MDSPKTLDEMETALEAAKLDPKSMFGTDIDNELQRLQIFCHPDRWPDDQERATKLFAQLGQVATAAKAPAMQIKSPTREYVLERRLAVGDVSDVYAAAGHDISPPQAVVTNRRVLLQPVAREPARPYLVKLSRLPGAEMQLERERQALTSIHEAALSKNLETYSRYYPLLVESFPVVNRFKRRVNVFHGDARGLYTLKQVLDRHFPLDCRHTVWIFKRLLTALGFAHQQGVIHTAVNRDHVLIRPDDHGLQLIGWGQSVEPGQPLQHYPKDLRCLYPSDAFDKKPTQSGADIHMAAMLMLGATEFLPGEKSIHQFFVGCSPLSGGQWQRPVDAFELYDEFMSLAKRVYGEPRFIELKM